MASIWKKVTQKLVKTVGKDEHTQHSPYISSPILRAELQIPPPIIEGYQAGQHENTVREGERSRIDRNRFRVEFATLVFTVLAFGVLCWTLAAAWQQTRTAQDTLKITAQNFCLDQRAWIDISVEGKETRIVENTPLVFVVRITNTGKTLARDFVQNAAVRIVPSSQPPDFSGDFPFVRSTTGMITPNKSFDIPVSMLSKEKRTVVDPPGPTKAEIEDLLAGRAYIAVFGKATYRDIYGVPQWVRFCTARVFAAGEYYAQQCTEYNNVDDNKCGQPPE